MTIIVLRGTVQSIAVQTPSCWQERGCNNLSAVLLLFRDHDDDVSVAEACKKLNEVSGLRGMGRYAGEKNRSVTPVHLTERNYVPVSFKSCVNEQSASL